MHEKEVASAGLLPELLHSSSSNLQAIVANIIEKAEGENILIIADGWDELSKLDVIINLFVFLFLFCQSY